jgi:hypothetical protein
LAKDPGHRFLPDDLRQYIIASNGVTRLWLAIDAGSKEIDGFTITEIMQWPRARELRFWLIGGRNLVRWREDMRQTLEEYAKAEGCDYVACFGRKAWARMPGYKQMSHVAIYKDLSEIA